MKWPRNENHKLVRNANTNYLFARYSRFNDHLFMDTMFSSSKGGKSQRGDTCAQIFVTDRWFIAAYPLPLM